LLESKTERAFEGILTSAELHSRHEIALEQYAKQMKIECNIMIDMFRTQILPAALKYQKIWARSLALVKELNMATELQERDLRHFSGHIEQAIAALDELAKVKIEIEGLGWEALAKVFCELALPHMENARKAVDALELWVDNELWPMPKYRELLYLQ
jgi:glutamine synthetase